MKILVVEDEPTAAAFLAQGLREEGFLVDLASRSSEAEESVAVYEYDAILLDVMIPGSNGFELCQRWKANGVQTPILFLTARDEVCDRVRGLDLGGDDYLVKPYSFDELLARLRVLLRRMVGVTGGSELVFGDLSIDMSRRTVRLGTVDVDLTAKEYQLLEYFALHAHKLVTRTMLWEHVWESSSEPDSNVIDVYVGYLRKKLGRSPGYIHTRRGSGYVFEHTHRGMS